MNHYSFWVVGAVVLCAMEPLAHSAGCDQLSGAERARCERDATPRKSRGWGVSIRKEDSTGDRDLSVGGLTVFDGTFRGNQLSRSGAGAGVSLSYVPTSGTASADLDILAGSGYQRASGGAGLSAGISNGYGIAMRAQGSGTWVHQDGDREVVGQSGAGIGLSYHNAMETAGGNLVGGVSDLVVRFEDRSGARRSAGPGGVFLRAAAYSAYGAGVVACHLGGKAQSTGGEAARPGVIYYCDADLKGPTFRIKTPLGQFLGTPVVAGDLGRVPSLATTQVKSANVAPGTGGLNLIHELRGGVTIFPGH